MPIPRYQISVLGSMNIRSRAIQNSIYRAYGMNIIGGASIHHLSLEYPDQPLVDISDIFEPLIQFCFYGVSTLIENKKAIYSLQVSYGSCRFEDKAGLIHYTTKNEPSAVLPADEFLPALYHCGQRMLDVFWRFLDKKTYPKRS